MSITKSWCVDHYSVEELGHEEENLEHTNARCIGCWLLAAKFNNKTDDFKDNLQIILKICLFSTKQVC